VHFTGKERDTSGNDYFGARYYSSALGRWMSPDPSGQTYAEMTNPQSFNLYAYVMNNPLVNLDPIGLDCIYFTNDGLNVESIDPQNSTQNAGTGLNQQATDCGAHGGNWVNGTVGAVIPNSQGGFNVSSSDSLATYYTTLTSPDLESSGTGCFGNCTTGYSVYTTYDLKSMLVTGSFDDFLQWLPKNGAPGYAGAQYPLSTASKYTLGGKDGDNDYCGSNGAGIPLNNNDWACAMHDYNSHNLGDQHWLDAWDRKNPKGPQLQQTNQNLCDHVSGPEGLAIKAAFTLTYWGCR